jgi:hypothetical protein
MGRDEVISIYYTEKEGDPDSLYLYVRLRGITRYSLRTNKIFYDVLWISSVLGTFQGVNNFADRSVEEDLVCGY